MGKEAGGEFKQPAKSANRHGATDRVETACTNPIWQIQQGERPEGVRLAGQAESGRQMCY